MTGGKTPMFLAVERWDLERKKPFAKILNSQKVRSWKEKFFFMLKFSNCRGRQDTVETLLCYGASVTVQNFSGITPLSLCSENRWLQKKYKKILKKNHPTLLVLWEQVANISKCAYFGAFWPVVKICGHIQVCTIWIYDNISTPTSFRRLVAVMNQSKQVQAVQAVQAAQVSRSGNSSQPDIEASTQADIEADKLIGASSIKTTPPNLNSLETNNPSSISDESTSAPIVANTIHLDLDPTKSANVSPCRNDSTPARSSSTSQPENFTAGTKLGTGETTTNVDDVTLKEKNIVNSTSSTSVNSTNTVCAKWEESKSKITALENCSECNNLLPPWELIMLLVFFCNWNFS